ncbi:MAG: hypothetical protein O2968_21785, partial [Acidobacteria bacterium]|nr:hypothetical protein [Acidobacteriota bacterium]
MHLRNNLVNSELMVQPVLYTENGEAIALSPITLPPSASAAIPVNETVRKLGYHDPLFGGAEFHFDAAYPGALSVETEMIQPELNFAYSVQSFSARDGAANEQHSVFYRPTPATDVFFAMYNSSDQEVVVRPTVISGNRTIELDALTIPAHGFSKTRLSSDDVRGGLRSVGGIVLRHRGPAGALFTTGWLDDAETGFSTMMTFEEFAQSHNRTELFGAQIFTSYVSSDIVLKNISADMIRASAEFYHVQNGTLGTAAYDIGLIQAGAIRSIDVVKLQEGGVLPASIDELSVRVRYSGEPGALMGRVFGVSGSGTYGYYSQLEDHTSVRRSEIYWTAKQGARTLATIANFGDDDSVTIEMFNAQGESYSTQIELRANEAATIDLAEHGAKAFGEGSFGGWNVSRNGGGALVVKNHVRDDTGLSLPFYGVGNYVTELFFDPHFQFDFVIPTFQRPSASLFI